MVVKWEDPIDSLTPLIVWGTSSHALVVTDILRTMGCYRVVGFLDDFAPQGVTPFFADEPILGGREQLDGPLVKDVRDIIIAVGDCASRLALAGLARAKGLTLATAIHPRAVVADTAVIGAGSVITAGVVVSPAARIGENVIINTSATIEHECLIEDGVHVSAGVHVGGKTSIGRGAWVCIGATVVDRVHIGHGSVVGAGSVVMRDIPPEVVAYGIPARVIRQGAQPAVQD